MTEWLNDRMGDAGKILINPRLVVYEEILVSPIGANLCSSVIMLYVKEMFLLKREH